MGMKSTFVATLFASACLASAATVADDKSIHGALNELVKEALVEVSTDIENNITKNVASTSYQFLQGANGTQVIGRVTVTDVNSNVDVETLPSE